MADIFDQVEESLRKLSDAFGAQIPQTQELIDVWGWNTSVLTKDQIGERAFDLAERMKRLHDDQKVEPYSEWLVGIPEKIEKFKLSVLPQIGGGNASTVSIIYEQLMAYIEGRLPPENWPIQWEAAGEAGQLPTKLLRRLRALEVRLAEIEPRSQNIDEKIAQIEAAHSAAENLPIDLASLQEARVAVDKTAKEVAATADKVVRQSSAADEGMQHLSKQSEEALKLMDNIDSAYRASTSKALAEAFAKRSWWLQVQTWIFVFLLIMALAAGGFLGLRRVSVLEALLNAKTPITPSLLWLNVAISFLSVAAPVWFAWIATKQIGQRFKLAEDYGFKAAVANAYEGYRREAAVVDPLFVTRLFGSALARLEEAPLRLVDQENYGSPFHELTASPAFRAALGVVPALRDSYEKILDGLSKRVKSGAQEAASTVVSTAGSGASGVHEGE